MKIEKGVCMLLAFMMIILTLVVSLGSAAAQTTVKYGDVNGDEKVSMKDIMDVQKHIAYFITLKGDALIAADVTGDNQVSMKDVLTMQKYIARIISKFPAEDKATEPTTGPLPTDKGTTKIITDPSYINLDYHHTTIVYTPPGYDENKDYPVIYAHDGQNLFYAETSAYGHWKMLETLDELILSGKIEPVIMVGVYNNGAQRMYEYAPEEGGDEYLDYLVNTVKPYIDKNYSTKPEPENTGIMGSSMGGIISLYATVTHSDVFGKAGVVSPHWYNADWMSELIDKNGFAPDVKIWMDMGTGENLLPDLVRDSRNMTKLFMEKGLEPVDDFLYYEVPNGTHNEVAWAQRAHMVLLYLFGTEPITPVDIDIISSVTTNKVGASINPIPAVLCENNIIYTPTWETLTLKSGHEIATLDADWNRVTGNAPGEAVVSYSNLGKIKDLKLTFIDDVPIEVTWVVTVPDGIPENEEIYIVGGIEEFGDWIAADGVKMTRVDSTHFTYTGTFEIGTTIEYKYVMNAAKNDWTYVEKNEFGGDISNRQHVVRGTDTVEDVIAKISKY